MRAAVLCVILLVVANAELINMGTWVADTNNMFANMTREQKRQYLGTIIPTEKLAPKKVEPFYGAVPSSFNATEKWPTCIHPILNQADCGSCWAFGASESLSDRACIATNGSTNVVLSPEDLVSCDTGNFGCQGGYLNAAWAYMENPGIVTLSCYPYTAGNDDEAPACVNTCQDGSTWTVYKAKNSGALSAAQGKVEIFTNGPIETAFDVYEDFMNYTSGVYIQHSDQFLGGHAVKVLGWGSLGGQSYWLAQNSWGPSWGLNGFFLIGTSQCGFDTNFYAGDYAGSSTYA